MKIFYLLIALFGVSMGCFCFAEEITTNGIDDKKLTIHIIQRGDTLFSIAKRHGVSLEELQSWNNIINPNSVTLGQKITLRVPDNEVTTQVQSGSTNIVREANDKNLTFHIIQRGDTLFSIAKRNGVALEDLQKWNKIKNPNSVTVGQKITLRVPDNEVTTQVQSGSTKIVSEANDKKLTFHITQRGDTLLSIAEENGVSVDDLQKWNKIINPISVTLGQKIILRDPGEDNNINQEQFNRSNNEVTTQAQAGSNKLVSEAKLALTYKNYPLAISLLEKLSEIGDVGQRQFALEYIGVAREQYGQKESAKQAYQRFLDHYPTADAADRVKIRLNNLKR